MNNFSYLIKQGIASLWKNRYMSFASLCILTVSLLLVGLSGIVMIDCGIILDNVSDKNEISVYLDNTADIKSVEQQIKDMPLVEKYYYISPEEGLEKMIEQYSEQKELFENLPYNPVPPTFMVTINELDKIHTATADLMNIEGVYKVNAPMDFASFIKDIRTTFTVIGIVLIIALGTVSVIIIANTTRLSVFARRKEIAIMRIVGATNAFIKIPFFVEGLSIGILSGGLSFLITKIAYEKMYEMLNTGMGMWQALGMGNILTFSEISISVLIIYCCAGAILGALGTVFSTGKYLKV